MPSAMPPPESTPNRRRRPLSSPPLSPFSLPVSSPPVPIPTNGRFEPPSSALEHYILSNVQPVSAFSSTSSSEAGDLSNSCPNDLNQWNFDGLTELDEQGNPIPDGPMDYSQECQGIFSFEWGGPVPDLGPYTANVPRDQVVSADQIVEALRQFSLENFYPSYNTTVNSNGINVSIDGQTWSQSQSIANLPHLQASASNIASLPPQCPLCTLPLPISIPPMPSVPIFTINFVNPAHQSIFILTSPPPPYHLTNHEEEEDAGIYVYLSSTDMYLHTHPGPLPEYLPGYVGQTRVGRLRGDADEAIWLETGAGGLGQDWLRAFWDMCRNMRMPVGSPEWNDMFDERDWVASVVATTKRHGVVVP